MKFARLIIPLLGVLVVFALTTVASLAQTTPASPPAPSVVDVAQFVSAAAAAAMLGKIMVDPIRTALPDLKPLAVVVLAFVLCQLWELALTYMSAPELTGRTVVQSLIIGTLAFGTAVGSTELQKRADKA